MLQNPVLKNSQPQLRFSLNIDKVDTLFPGFMLGDFAVLHGQSSVRSLLTQLCVRAQLPYQLGGLETSVLFVDGDNSFRLYDVSALAQQYVLNPTDVLNRIFVSRAFTAYQHASLLLDKLQRAVDKYGSKLVLLSNPSYLYLDKDVQKKEAKEIFVQLTEFLSDFANDNQVIVVATHISRVCSKRNLFFKEELCNKADVVASVRKSYCRPDFVLEKHSFFEVGKTEFPSTGVTIADFVGA